MSRVLVSLAILALLAAGRSAEGADPVNCDPEKGMVDLDRCPQPKPPYDPFADKKLTCWEMRRYRDRIFTDNVDLGWPSQLNIDIDWSCKENLGSLPFLRRLDELTKTIRSDGSPRCTGTIVRYHWASYNFSLLEAGFAPERLLDKRALIQKFADAELQPTDAAVSDYFERWSYESLYNFDLYQAYMVEIAKATPMLTRHYQRNFKYPEQKARSLARLAIDIYVRFAAGSFPRVSVAETSRLLGIARPARGSLDDLEALFDLNPGEDDLRMALNVALLLQRPPAHLTLLVDRVGSLDYGDESALFFSLRNHRNVRFLLDRGAKINYQNGFGKTPLFYAIGFNDRPLVELLLGRGADVNHRYVSSDKKDKFDCRYDIEHTARAPLMHAAQHADVAMLQLLLRRGARLHEVDGLGDNATAYALRADRQPNVAYLKGLGLGSPDLERQIMSDKVARKCLEEGTRRGLKDKAYDRFFAACYEAGKPN